MIGKIFRGFLRGNRPNRPSHRTTQRSRRAGLEVLECRHLLTISLPTIDAQTVIADAPLNIALNGVDTAGNAITYSATITSSKLTNANVSNPTLTATPMDLYDDLGNQSLKISVSDAKDKISGSMTFQLLNNLVPTAVTQVESAVSEQDTGLTFYRVLDESSFQIIQGGFAPESNAGTQWDDVYNPDLQFTSGGVLAMANSGPDTNSSQFFITGQAQRSLDFRYTIFGFMTQGATLLQEIEKVRVQDNSSGEDSSPVNTVSITGVSLVQDNQDGVLQLSAPAGTSGTATVMVTAKDSVTGETSSQPFTVTIEPDTTVDPPYLNRPISPIQTKANTATTFSIPGAITSGAAIDYIASMSPANANLTLNVDSSTGEATLTPANGAYGVYTMDVSVQLANPTSTEISSADTQAVPVYIDPLAPTSIAFEPPAGLSSTFTNLDNSSADEALTFKVDGVVAGATVDLYVGSTLIGSGTVLAGQTSATILTNGEATLSAGANSITATQTLEDQTVSVGNLNTTTNLPSTASPALSLTIDATPPSFNSTANTNAQAGEPYAYQATTMTDAAGAVTYSLTQSPAGMTINASTGIISWIPTAAQVGDADATIQAEDPAGNTATQAFSITVAPHVAPILTPQNPLLATLDLNTPGTFALSSFISNGSGTAGVATGITDNALNPLGGIAVTAVAGAGTWEYSLDGSTYQEIGAVSASSALLLPNTAYVRYVPDGMTAEPAGTATITYLAWDATSGTSGTKVDASTNGGTTAFSMDADAASPTVADASDNVVLTPANPSLGQTDFKTAKTIALGSFINTPSGISTTIALAASDTAGTAGGIALVGATGDGSWSYLLHGSTTPVSVGSVALDSALLLPANASLVYTPDNSHMETPTIAYYAWDASNIAASAAGSKVDLSGSAALGGSTAYSLFSDTASLTVTAIPPVLTPAHPSLGATDLVTAKSIGLSAFINKGAGTTKITDAASGAAIGGIAVTATSGKGTWSYSLDGTTFTAIGAVSATSALPLPSTAELQYTPDGADAETPTISYVAWDTTVGAAGTKLDTTAAGSAAAFSTASDTASLTVANASLSGYVFLDTNNDGQYMDSQGDPKPGFGNVTLLLLGDGSGSWTEVAKSSPVQTAADGAYSFPSVPAGTYQIEIVPPTEVAMGQITAGAIAGATSGTVGTDTIQVSVAPGQSGAGYNFGVLGIEESCFSLRLLLASTPPLPQYIANIRIAPTINLAGSGGGPGYSTTYTPSGTSTPATVEIGPAATISGADSPSLVAMTISIQNPPNGSSEQLQLPSGATSGTNVTSSFANGVLTLSGLADAATYQTLLESVVYSDAASSPTAGVREISVVVDDGVSASDAVFAAITVE